MSVRRLAATLVTTVLALAGTVPLAGPAGAVGFCNGSRDVHTSADYTIMVPTYNGDRHCPMQRGSTGNGVRELQRALNHVCNNSQGISVDGSFGPATEAALKRYQAWAGITPDGLYGPETRKNIYWLRTDRNRKVICVLVL